MIKAFIFDFDGLILDTETPEVQGWTTIYAEYGLPFPQEEWEKTIGGYGISNFDAARHLRDLIGNGITLDDLRARHRSESDLLTARQPILPGVVEVIEEAKRRGLHLAVASSSPHSWVDGHLSRLRLTHYFDKVICSDDVPPGRTKPNPDLFLRALLEMHIQPEEAIIFEDSPNGVKAARTAGIFVVAVPNSLTSTFVFEGESMRLTSLLEFPMSEVLDSLAGKAKGFSNPEISL